MNISEMGIGSTVKIIATLNGNLITFDSFIVKVHSTPIGIQYGVYLPTIKQDDKVLNFDNVRVKVEVTNCNDNRIYVYNITYFQKCSSEVGDYYLCVSPDNARPKNYRGTVRVPYCEECILQVGVNKKALSAFVRDISITGISFTFPNEQFSTRIGDNISATFKVFGNQIKVAGSIVRLQEEDGRTVIGCTLGREYPIVNKLVNHLQVRNRT